MPRKIDHPQMRDALAKRCVAAFAQHGYGSVSMRTLAEIAQTSTGTLYHYFGSKASLFRHVVTVVSELDMAEGSRVLVQAFPDPQDRVEPLMLFVFGQMSRLATHFRVLAEFSIHPDNPGEPWLHLMQESRRRYLDAFRTALQLDDDAKIDIALLTICGLVLRTMCGDPSTDPGPVIEKLREVLR